MKYIYTTHYGIVTPEDLILIFTFIYKTKKIVDPVPYLRTQVAKFN